MKQWFLDVKVIPLFPAVQTLYFCFFQELNQVCGGTNDEILYKIGAYLQKIALFSSRGYYFFPGNDSICTNNLPCND